jgi:sugar lactone lactonase YvrE
MDTAKLGTESVVVRNQAVLGEAPIWDARTQNLVWVDIIVETVHFFDPVANKDRAVAVGEPVGSVATSGGISALTPSGCLDVLVRMEIDNSRRRITTTPSLAMLICSISTWQPSPLEIVST